MSILKAACAALGLLFFTASPAGSNEVPQIEQMQPAYAEWWCDSIDKFAKWINATNQYGPIMLEVPELHGCKKTRVEIIEIVSLHIIKAFNLPMLAIEAIARDEGQIYTVVPLLQAMPFGTGNGA